MLFEVIESCSDLSLFGTCVDGHDDDDVYDDTENRRIVMKASLILQYDALFFSKTLRNSEHFVQYTIRKLNGNFFGFRDFTLNPFTEFLKFFISSNHFIQSL